MPGFCALKNLKPTLEPHFCFATVKIAGRNPTPLRGTGEHNRNPKLYTITKNREGRLIQFQYGDWFISPKSEYM
jgi:hypothetical protein